MHKMREEISDPFRVERPLQSSPSKREVRCAKDFLFEKPARWSGNRDHRFRRACRVVDLLFDPRSTTTDNSGANSPLGKPINSTLYDQLTGVSTSTLAAVGAGSATTQGLQKPTGSPLTLNGKPEFLYIGADYCPYCAVERWAMAVALSKFGTLSGMSYMISAPTELQNITTLSFFKRDLLEHLYRVSSLRDSG